MKKDLLLVTFTEHPVPMTLSDHKHSTGNAPSRRVKPHAFVFSVAALDFPSDPPPFLLTVIRCL